MSGESKVYWSSFNGLKRNEHVYARLSSELAKQGNKSGEQCRCKVRSYIRSTKKKSKMHIAKQVKRSRFYDSLNDILGSQPATCLPVVLDTTDD